MNNAHHKTGNSIDNHSLGDSIIMGRNLREEVIHQLKLELKYYGIENYNLYKFDWSESCIEGHIAKHLDGVLENFSGIGIVNEAEEIIGEGWMDFILEKDKDLFLVYFTFLDIKNKNYKNRPGIPNHIWLKIPEELQSLYKNRKEKELPYWLKEKKTKYLKTNPSFYANYPLLL